LQTANHAFLQAHLLREELEEPRLKVLVAPKDLQEVGLGLGDARFVGVSEDLEHPHHLVAAQLGFDVQEEFLGFDTPLLQ